jgi:hypothetical protein
LKRSHHNIFFNRQFFRRKLVKIAENCYHNIEPGQDVAKESGGLPVLEQQDTVRVLEQLDEPQQEVGGENQRRTSGSIGRRDDDLGLIL